MGAVVLSAAIVPRGGFQVEIGKLRAAHDERAAVRVQNAVAVNAERTGGRGCYSLVMASVGNVACRGKLQRSRCQQQHGNEADDRSGAHDGGSISER